MVKRPKIDSVKALTLYWIDYTSGRGFHGVGNIINNKYLSIKIIWTISFLACLGYFLGGLFVFIIDFLHYNVNTFVSTKRLLAIDFPTVTICNQNPFNTENSRFFLKDKFLETKSLYIDTPSTFDQTEGSNFQTVLQGAEYHTKTSINEMNLTDSEKQVLSFNIDDMFISCMYNNYPCQKTDFILWYTSSYGNCYKFNSGINRFGNKTNIRNISSPGRKNAFRIEMFVGYSNLNMDFIRSTGLKVFVHNQSSIPLTESEGIDVSPGFETDIVLAQTIYNKQSFPYSNCIQNTTSPDEISSFSYRKTIEITPRYRQKYCLQVCRQKYIIDNCDCYDANSPNLKLSVPCTVEQIKICVQNTTETFYGGQKSVECFNECPIECEYSDFKVTTSVSNFPTEMYAQMILRSQNLKKSPWRNFTSIPRVQESVLAVQVYFDDIAWTIIDEMPVRTIEQFIAFLGGHVGVTLGGSILTFVSLLEIVLQLLGYLIYEKLWKQSRREHS